MPFADGTYSRADLAKKMRAAIVRVSKSDLQGAVDNLIDSLGMVQKLSPGPLYLSADEDSSALRANVEQAMITEWIAIAIQKSGSERWQAWQEVADDIWRSLRLLLRFAESRNKTINVSMLDKLSFERKLAAASKGR